jgi:hypothetical protein
MSLRVFLGLSEIAGYFGGLEEGLREAGVDARFFDLSANPLSYGRSGPTRMSGVLALKDSPRGSLRGRLWSLALLVNRVTRRARAALLLPWALARYDAFVLGGHETFLGGRELRLMRRLGKVVVVVFTGSDHRPPYLSGHGLREHPDTSALAEATRRTAERIRRAERGASAVVALPESAQLHRRPFVHFLAIGYPFATRRVAAAGVGADEEPRTHTVRVLHCPTDVRTKGTDQIRAAVERCRERGLAVEYREISGRPNAEVLRALQWADLVVDEVYGDTPMAGFVTEAAYFGRPAVVGSYAAGGDRVELPDGAAPPSAFCRPDQLPDEVARLVADADARRELGARAQRFVRERWAPRQVAERMLRVIGGDVPPEWMVSPSDLRYVHGWGIGEADLRHGLRRLIDERGVDALAIPAGGTLAAAVTALAEA